MLARVPRLRPRLERRVLGIVQEGNLLRISSRNGSPLTQRKSMQRIGVHRKRGSSSAKRAREKVNSRRSLVQWLPLI